VTNDEREAQATAFHEANSSCFTEFESFDSGWKAGAEYARRTVSGQEAALTAHIINGEVIDAQNIGNLMDGEYRLYAAPIPATGQDADTAEPDGACNPADICAGCRCEYSAESVARIGGARGD
jgi:hypothetical protein